jgi:hypothetical protein
MISKTPRKYIHNFDQTCRQMVDSIKEELTQKGAQVRFSINSIRKIDL